MLLILSLSFSAGDRSFAVSMGANRRTLLQHFVFYLLLLNWQFHSCSVITKVASAAQSHNHQLSSLSTLPSVFSQRSMASFTNKLVICCL